MKKGRVETEEKEERSTETIYRRGNEKQYGVDTRLSFSVTAEANLCQRRSDDGARARVDPASRTLHA